MGSIYVQDLKQNISHYMPPPQTPMKSGLCSECGMRKEPVTADDLLAFPVEIPFSARQRRVIVLLCGGLTNKQIAERMNTSEQAIKKVLNAIYARVGYHNRTAVLLRMIKFKYEGV